MEREQNSIRVLMLPWLAYGHISPYLELAKKLTKRNFYIYLCSTPVNLSSIKKRIEGDYSFSIQLVELPLESSPELPPHLHTTNGLPLHLNPNLHKAFKMVTPTFTNIVETLSPDLVIYDFNQPWAPAIASSYNIPAVMFLPCAASMPTFGLHLLRKQDAEFPCPEFSISGYLEKQFLTLIAAAKAKEGEGEAFQNAIALSCNVVLVHTFKELEANCVDYLSSLVGKKIVPVGPLVPETSDDVEEHAEIIQWLDKKGKSSTVFVSFGSEYFLSKEDMEEVAHGLELSGVNFIWVVRFPSGVETNVEEALPVGYIDKVGKRGLVVKNWAPQARILAHPSTGGFVSHCGWSSTLESLMFGVPIVSMPMHLDQPLNARVVENIGVAAVVKRDDKGKLSRESIAQAIRKVVVSEEGVSIRTKARQFSETMRAKGGEEIDEVVKELVQLSKNRKN